MRILATGASGFVGSHTVRALFAAGHEVRASARSAARVRAALAAHGCADAAEIAEAALDDASAVRAALAGCDAVVHAGGVYSHDARRAREALAVNPRGTEVVLGTACALGLDPIVHVSSYVALLGGRGDGPLAPDAPLGDPPTPYARSKARADAIARGFQERGHPVTIVYPGMVWGPHDPADGESARLARNVLAGRVPLAVPGGVPVTDVRDLAAVYAALAAPGRGPRRYMASAAFVPLAEVMRTLAVAGGRRPPRGVMPPRLALALGRASELAQRVAPFRLPLDGQGVWTAMNGRPLDTHATCADLGVAFRAPSATLADTASWVLAQR